MPAIALVGCLAIGAVAAPEASGAALASAAVRTASWRSAAPVDAAGSSAGSSAAPAPCAPGVDTYNRTQLCWRVTATVAVLRGAKRVGTVTFDLTHDIRLNPRGRDFAERITISSVHATGSAAGMSMTLHASCARPCSAADRFPRGAVIANGLTGVVDYSDAVSAGHADSARTVYQLSFVKPGDRSTGFAYDTPIAYRCDDALPGVPAGCVFPAYRPYLTMLTSLPTVGYDVYQAEGDPGHYGQPGDGHPLHRMTSAAAQAANYAAVCARSVVGRPPRSGDACDEYPFRSTREGGKGVSKANRRADWVPAAEEKTKNALITSFYNANRVLNGDAFWVLV